MRLDYKVGTFLGAPIYIHLSVAICFIYFVAVYDFLPGLVSGVCFVILMLIHEIGHAWYVKKYKHDLVCIKLGLIHGSCEYEHDERYAPETMIFAGGLFFQAVLFIICLVLVGVFSILKLDQFEHIYGPVMRVFININAFVFIINMLPIPGLDGFDIWSRIGEASTEKIRAYNRKFRNKKPKENRKNDVQKSPEKIVEIAIKRAQKNSRSN